MSTARLWLDAFNRAGRKPNLYEHERLYQARRDAADELYNALERLFAVAVSLKFERGDGPPIASDAAYDIAVNAARSALAKARGEQVPE